MITTRAVWSARPVHRCVGLSRSRQVAALVVVICVVAHGGCDQGAPVPAASSGSPAVLPPVETGPVTGAAVAAGQSPPKNQDQVSAPSAPPAGVPAAPNVPSPAGRAAPTTSSGRLRLSAGVALAQ